MGAEPDVAPRGDRLAGREDRHLDLEAGELGRAHRLEPRVAQRRVEGGLHRAVVEREGRLGLADAAAQATQGADLPGVLAIERDEHTLPALPPGPARPRRELAAEVVTLEEVGGQGGAGEPHEPGAVGGREGRRVGRRVLEPRQRGEGRSERHARRGLAQECHCHVRHRAVVLHRGQVARRVVREGHGAGARRDPGQQLQQGGEAVAAADRVAGLLQVVAEPPRVHLPEELAPRSSIARTFARTAGDSAPNGWKSKRGP